MVDIGMKENYSFDFVQLVFFIAESYLKRIEAVIL
jgi:hypothetical protein